MGCLPSGSSRNVETSKSPKTVIATVRGIGVAVITKRCGGFCAFSFKASRCSTPNRCCSSTTIKPKSLNSTFSPSNAWVPITIPASPDAANASAALRAAAFCDPVIKVTCVAFSSLPNIPPCANGPRSFSMVRRCCAARTSVGASNAACPPLSTTANMARRATIVLPEPTSPCSKRCMGWARAKSASISAHTWRCPPVNSKGSDSSKACKIPPLITFLEIVLSFLSSLRRKTRSDCSKKASSKVKRSRALSADSRSAGR